jgi:hypothetical protein
VSQRLEISPVTLREARAYCGQFHRHHAAPQGGLFAIACTDGIDIKGIVIVGRPVSRMLQDGYTAEVTRLATGGVKNGCSMLYAAAWRAARAMGYRRLITYILASETGTSLRAAGWKLIGQTKAESWHRDSRPRVDKSPLQSKMRWERQV